MKKRLAMVGAGMMGEALARGLFASRLDLRRPDLLRRRRDPQLETIAESTRLGVDDVDDAVDACAQATGVLLAVKPQDAGAALETDRVQRRQRTGWCRSSPG